MRSIVYKAHRLILNFLQFIFILAAFFTQTSRAASATKLRCDDPQIDKKMANTTESPWEKKAKQGIFNGYSYRIYSDNFLIHGQKLNLKYEIYQAHQNQNFDQTPVIFYFCGGPGISCTADGHPEEIVRGIPVVIFDYIGINQNEVKNQDPEVMSIESQAEFALQILKKINPKRVIFYGQSFGTSVATVAASRLVNEAQKPELVILDGVIDKPNLLNTQPVVQELEALFSSKLGAVKIDKIQSAWIKNLGSLRLNQKQTVIKQAQMEVLEGIKNGYMTFSDALDAVVYKNYVKDLLESIKIEADSDQGDTSGPTTPGQAREYRAAGCQVRSKFNNLSFNGALKFLNPINSNDSEDNSCECALIKRNYYAEEFPLQGMNILYLNSLYDMQTPFEGAWAHARRLSRSNQVYFVAGSGQAHGLLGSEMNQCALKFFKNIAHSKEFSWGLMPECLTKKILDTAKGDQIFNRRTSQ